MQYNSHVIHNPALHIAPAGPNNQQQQQQQQQQQMNTNNPHLPPNHVTYHQVEKNRTDNYVVSGGSISNVTHHGVVLNNTQSYNNNNQNQYSQQIINNNMPLPPPQQAFNPQQQQLSVHVISNTPSPQTTQSQNNFNNYTNNDNNNYNVQNTPQSNHNYVVIAQPQVPYIQPPQNGYEHNQNCQQQSQMMQNQSGNGHSMMMMNNQNYENNNFTATNQTRIIINNNTSGRGYHRGNNNNNNYQPHYNTNQDQNNNNRHHRGNNQHHQPPRNNNNRHYNHSQYDKSKIILPSVFFYNTKNCALQHRPSINSLNSQGKPIFHLTVTVPGYTPTIVRDEQYHHLLLIKFCPLDMKEEDLRSLFEEFGEINYLEVKHPLRHTMKFQVAFVAFVKLDDAKCAIGHLHNHKFGPKLLKVEFFESALTPAGAAPGTIIEQHQLPIDKVQLSQYSTNGMQNYDPTKVPSKTIVTFSSEPNPDDDGPKTKLYVANIPARWTEEYFRQHFAGLFDYNLRDVIFAKILKDSKRKNSRRVGFVEFSNVADASDAKDENHNRIVDHGGESLVVRFANNDLPKDQLRRGDGERRRKPEKKPLGNTYCRDAVQALMAEHDRLLELQKLNVLPFNNNNNINQNYVLLNNGTLRGSSRQNDGCTVNGNNSIYNQQLYFGPLQQQQQQMYHCPSPPQQQQHMIANIQNYNQYQQCDVYEQLANHNFDNNNNNNVNLGSYHHHYQQQQAQPQFNIPSPPDQMHVYQNIDQHVAAQTYWESKSNHSLTHPNHHVNNNTNVLCNSQLVVNYQQPQHYFVHASNSSTPISFQNSSDGEKCDAPFSNNNNSNQDHNFVQNTVVYYG